jgi:hypothetical protein
MVIFCDPRFNLFSIFLIFWNFSKVQKSHVTSKLNKMVQYLITYSMDMTTEIKEALGGHVGVVAQHVSLAICTPS